MCGELLPPPQVGSKDALLGSPLPSCPLPAPALHHLSSRDGAFCMAGGNRGEAPPACRMRLCWPLGVRFDAFWAPCTGPPPGVVARSGLTGRKS